MNSRMFFRYVPNLKINVGFFNAVMRSLYDVFN